MKFCLLLIASLFAASSSAFSPSFSSSLRAIRPTSSTSTSFSTTSRSTKFSSRLSAGKDELVEIATKANPLLKFYDPMNLAEAEFWGDTNDATIGFLRHAEIKHGRVSMAAFVGYIAQSTFTFPWKMTLDGLPHPSTALSPEAQWDAIPEEAKWQILFFVGALEVWGEQSSAESGITHYMRGGKPGKYPSFDLFRETVHPLPFDLYDPFGLSKNMSEEKKEERLVMEINNGRLAQIGILGFMSADRVAGSVPFLNDIAKAYDGDSMAPFTAHYHFFG